MLLFLPFIRGRKANGFSIQWLWINPHTADVYTFFCGDKPLPKLDLSMDLIPLWTLKSSTSQPKCSIFQILLDMVKLKEQTCSSLILHTQRALPSFQQHTLWLKAQSKERTNYFFNLSIYSKLHGPDCKEAFATKKTFRVSTKQQC